MPDSAQSVENWDWKDLADNLKCTCKASDQWRCARARNLYGCIACYCPCHKYAFTPKPKAKDETPHAK